MFPVLIHNIFFQTCDELGFSYTDKEWVQIRKMLEDLPNLQGSNPEDLMVRSEDFFSAIHAIMSIKQNRHRIEGKNLKVNNVCSFWLLASCLKDLVTRSLKNYTCFSCLFFLFWRIFKTKQTFSKVNYICNNIFLFMYIQSAQKVIQPIFYFINFPFLLKIRIYKNLFFFLNWSCCNAKMLG